MRAPSELIGTMPGVTAVRVDCICIGIKQAPISESLKGCQFLERGFSRKPWDGAEIVVIEQEMDEISLQFSLRRSHDRSLCDSPEHQLIGDSVQRILGDVCDERVRARFLRYDLGELVVRPIAGGMIERSLIAGPDV